MSDLGSAPVAPNTGARARAERVRAAVKEWPRWKKITIAGAAVCIATGFVLLAVESSRPPAQPLSGGGHPPGAAGSLVDGQPQPNGAPAEGTDTSWSPVFLRFGFSFFVGFALGTAVRTVLTLVLVFCGLFAAAMLGLGELGFIEVHWEAMGKGFDSLVGAVGQEAKSLKGLLTGRLPSAGLAVLGLYTGFKRR